MKLKHAGLAILISFCLIVGMITPLSAATAETPSIEDSTLNWSQFLGNEGLQGISDAKTPTSGDNMELLWQAGKGSHTSGNMGFNEVPGTPIVVGDYVYVYYSEELHKLDLETGEEVASAPVFGKSTNQFFIYIAYGDGKIFVPCDSNTIDAEETGVSKNHIRVYDAETLEQLYITEEIGDSGMQTPIFYHDGYIFTGGYFRNNYYACFDVTDDNPDSDNEVKEAEWKVQTTSTKGFCWNGAAFVGDYCIFADSGYRTGSTVWSVNYKTGEVVDTFTMSGYECNASIVYYEKNNRVYISANHPDDCASIISYEVLPNGELDQDSKMEWASGVEYGGTQSTPVIYNDRLYIGGGGGTMGSNEPFHVVDANTMTTIYTIDGLLSKGSAAISTAYATEENGNQVYIYMVPYAPESHIEGSGRDQVQVYTNSYLWIIKDKEGQTEPEYEIVENVGEPEFCSQSIAIAANGSLIWYNDAGYVYCYGNTENTATTATDLVNRIDRFPDVGEFKYYNSIEVRQIQERYQSLDAAEQEKVTNYDKLIAILAIADQDPLERFNEGTASLADIDAVTLDDSEKVQMLLNAYAAFSDEEKAAVTGYDNLLAAKAKIEKLEKEAAVTALVADIDKLPDTDKLTTANKAAVSALQTRYETLDDESQKLITNYSKVTDAAARIEEIETYMEEVEDLIEEKLSGITITLESKSIIQEIDEVMQNIPPEDQLRITAIEQFLSPAKVELVNLMLEELVENGEAVEATQENKEALQALLDEINQYYAGILEADRKYVQGYDAVATVQAAIDALEDDNPTAPTDPTQPTDPTEPEGETPVPETGDGLPAVALLLTLIACGVLLLSRKRKQKLKA